MGNKSSRHGQRRVTKKGATKRSVTEHDDSYHGYVRASGVEVGVPHETTDYTPAEGQSEGVYGHLTQVINKEGSEAIEESKGEGRMDRHPTPVHNGEDAKKPSGEHGHVRSGDGDDIPTQQRPLLPRPVQTVVELRVALHSQAKEEVNIHTLQSVPPNVQALKKHVQCNYNVPISGQTILFDSVPLRDHETLPLPYMRTGDTIDIHFLSEVDIEYISNVLNTLKHTAANLDSFVPHLCRATGIRMELRIQQLQEIEALVRQHFYASSTELSKANFLFFCESRGPELLFQIHRHLLTHPSESLCNELKVLEAVCVYLCWGVTQLSATYNMLSIQHPVIDIITRIASDARAKWCPVCKSLAVSQESSKETKYFAISALTNIIEFIPNFRVQVASDEALTMHLIHALSTRVLTNALDYKIHRAVVYGFMCMAYSPETHQHLVKPHIIDCVMTAPTKQSDKDYNHSRYMATLFLAMIASNSTARCMIPKAQLKSISAYMSTFLNNVKIDELNKYEKELGSFWMTMQPHMQVAYTPLPPATNRVSPQQGNEREQPDEYELVLRCIEVAIVSIHVMNLNPENKDVLKKDGLLDYVQCLPWHMPLESKALHRALQLVTMLEDMRAHPPTLTNIAKAKLAATHFGLDAVLHKHIHELGAELYSCNT